MFDFTSTSEFELSVSGNYSLSFVVSLLCTNITLEGDSVNVLEPDDGSGWVKVTNTRGAGGLVPASYLDFDGAEASTPTNQQGSGQYGKCLHTTLSLDKFDT